MHSWMVGDGKRYILVSSINMGQITLERILEVDNLRKAYKSVVSNKGSAGVDKMPVSKLADYCWKHPHEISQSVLAGRYKPSPIRRVYIPKENGDKRPLGIPTVIDRFVQQAVAQVLSEEYEKVFSNNSFGFRPYRSCRDAVWRALEYLNSGLEWVIDLDLAKFFDTVNHSKLLQILSERIKDGRVISLIHKFLKAPVFEDGRIGPKRTIGTPQGGCISPVLANIMLNELDQMLDSRGIKFVRYADDMVIMCGSRKAAERILAHVKDFVENKLFLKVNEGKTKILKASKETQFLGFGFTTRPPESRRKSRPKAKYFDTVHKKKIVKLKKDLRILLDRRAPGGIETVKRRLKQKLEGWSQYFLTAASKSLRGRIDMWIRRRIRQLLWKQWKTPENRYNEFRKRWKKAPNIGEYAYSSNRYWHMAVSHQIHTALSNSTLRKEGWTFLADCL